MKWFEKFFGSSGSAPYRYDEGDEYPGYNGPRQSSGPWNGPSIFEDFRRSGEGTSYSNGGPAYTYERPHHHDARPPPYSSNDNRPMYSNGRIPHYRGDFSTEENDRAIALALSEEDHRRHGRASDADFDAELARAMQESLNLEYRVPRRSSDVASNAPPPRSNGMGVCAGCDESLGYGRFLSCLGKNWHPNCFCCKLCSKPIADREFSVQGSEAYHRECYKELFHPKCEVCTNFIPTNAGGLIEYRSHPFWNQKYCPRHERDGTPRCCSCDRIQVAGTEYVPLEPGRKLCSDCHQSAIYDTKECQTLYRDILRFYKVDLAMEIDQEIPMLLVERSALNAAREGEKEEFAHTAETRGLCLSEEQTITTVFGNKPGFSRAQNMRTENHKLTRHCEVTAILVLFGLPRLLTGSILAHELMHAWLRLRGNFPHMRPEIEEGICQVMSHIWLTEELKQLRGGRSTSSSSTGGNSTEARLGDFYLHQIATDSSPIYGEGYRRGYAAFQQFGLKRVLEHLRMTADFP